MQRPPSQLIESSGGAIEFAIQGEGPAVMICHGTGGGLDQNDLEQVHEMDQFLWEDILAPTLLIHGEKDRFIPLEYSWEVASRMPHTELFIINGGGHECLISHRSHVSPIIHSSLAKHIPK